ncbi:MAG: DUF3990 domain-containing protein [Bacteroidales bacterium]|nr:DUF3990 domain-containing protein [Bacteroidales bacterium]
MIKLYHGSTKIVDHPEFGIGNPKNDYGLGFYCTQDLEMAKEWACTDDRSGFANSYLLDAGGLSTLDLNGEDYHILNWLAVLLDNRVFELNGGLPLAAKEYVLDNYLPEYNNYDIIKGYRADDSYFSFSRDFLNGTISLEQLGVAMRLGKLGEQVVLKSHEAFEAITFVDAERAERDLYYPKRMSRDRKAREEYRKQKEINEVATGTYIIDIIRQGWKNDDARLRQDIS